MNEEPVVAEVEELPTGDAIYIQLMNPRKKDGKELHYLDEGVSSMLMPWHRINFIQIMPSAGVEEVIGFVRE
jgi:hypothetical protein